MMNYEDEVNYDHRKVKSSWTNVQLCSLILDWEEGVNYPEKEIFGLKKQMEKEKGGIFWTRGRTQDKQR